MKNTLENRKFEIEGPNLELVLGSKLFRNWLSNLDPKFLLRSVLIQSVDIVTRKGKEEILFLKLKSDITNEAGEKVPGIVFLRGAAVGNWKIFLSAIACRYDGSGN